MQHCVIYVRVSTKEQEAEGYSIPAQLKACRAFCAEQQLSPTAEFIETESAGKTGRRRFGEMLEYLRINENARTVVVHKLDRLYRNFSDPVALEEDLGASIRCVIGDMPATPQGELSKNVQLAVAKFYLDNLRQEVKKGMEEKVAQGGWPHRAPVGYLNDKNTRSLAVDFENAPLVRHAFERYASGNISMGDLGGELYSMGLRTRAGNRMPPSSLYNLLTNPIYCGLIRYKGELYPGAHEPIISQELWEQAQTPREARRNGERKRTKHVYAMRDWLYCAECGCKITVEGQRDHNYYRCTHGRGECSDRTYTREEQLIAQMDEILARIEFPEDLIEVLVKEAAQLDAEAAKGGNTEHRSLERELTRNKDKAGRLLDGYLEGVIPVGDYQAKVSELELDRQGIERRLATTAKAFQPKKDKVEALARTASTARAVFNEADTAGKRRVLDTVLLNAQVAEGEIVSYQLKDPIGVFEIDSDGVPSHSWWAILGLNQ